MSSVLRAEGLVRSFKRRCVVDQVEIEVRQGEVVGLLGPNGAGKTTTFYMIVGLLKADEGRVYLDDDELTRWPMYKRARAGIGYLPQEASVFQKLTVEQNVMAILETLKMSRQDRRDRLEELLDDIRSPGESGAGWRSPGRWRPGPSSSCWTSRSPGSIRSRSTTSSASYGV